MTEMEMRVLVIDDEKNIRRSIALLLEDAGYRVNVAEDAIRGLEKLRSEVYDLVLLDIKMGEISGLDLFQKLRSEKIQVPVVFMSGNASLSEAVETLKLGGADFLEKPFEPEQLLISVARALRLGELEKKIDLLKKNQSATKSVGDEILGNSVAVRNLLSDVERAAPTKSKVLIYGETGTGKELIARALHRNSHLSDGPFIKVNCAAIPADLIESELFGHERGAFTGAHQLKKGLFELAHKGTLFLDEIGEMSATAQAKVLRVLQNQEFSRVGGSQVIRVDVRIVAATHRDLANEVKEGRFREDLFFRINVVPIFSPSLRERSEDIPLLLSRFVDESCKENGFLAKDITSEALDVLMQYSWPGNVRELKNLAERLVVFSGETIGLQDLPPEILSVPAYDASSAKPNSGPVTLDGFKQKTERDYIVSILKQCNGNVTQSAKILNLERTYLHRKIQEHGIQKKEYF